MAPLASHDSINFLGSDEDDVIFSATLYSSSPSLRRVVRYVSWDLVVIRPSLKDLCVNCGHGDRSTSTPSPLALSFSPSPAGLRGWPSLLFFALLSLHRSAQPSSGGARPSAAAGPTLYGGAAVAAAKPPLLPSNRPPQPSTPYPSPAGAALKRRRSRTSGGAALSGGAHPLRPRVPALCSGGAQPRSIQSCKDARKGRPSLATGGGGGGGFVKLISAEGFEFVVDKKAAMVSNTLRNMLTSPGGFSETRQGEVRFPEIPIHILEKICQYFYWSLHYSRNKFPIPEYPEQKGLQWILFLRFQLGFRAQQAFASDILICGKETAEFPIEPEITLELMMAANYLDT
ncbi:hypothetical protein U9M48_000168 [Paspalum notatum var. saurae]|uniref:Elongin-C n=1 Tax=Paspalum notatum var. saurae TaxID=547442 RepID=A0AAQ3SHW0_PASNO